MPERLNVRVCNVVILNEVKNLVLGAGRRADAHRVPEANRHEHRVPEAVRKM
jgi:hypothetical protein